jgi:adenine deaminase
LPGGVLTKKTINEVKLNKENEFIFDSKTDISKVAVVERHNNTGNVAVGLLKGYGIKKGAIAQSIAHDSHNIIVVGTNDDDMYIAVNELIKQQGGVIAVLNGEVISSIPMPVAGLMSDQSGEWVRDKLTEFNSIAFNKLKIDSNVEPIMTLCFMSLAVIPEIKLTDKGLFDVTKFEYIDINPSCQNI